MSLFQVSFDGQHDWVEAKDFNDAIRVWKEWVIAQEGEEEMGEFQPEGVALVSDSPVIRAAEASPVETDNPPTKEDVADLEGS